MTNYFEADWINDDKMAHGGIYCVRQIAGQQVVCTTNPYKDGWEKAQTIAAAMNEKVCREGPNSGVPTNV